MFLPVRREQSAHHDGARLQIESEDTGTAPVGLRKSPHLRIGRAADDQPPPLRVDLHAQHLPEPVRPFGHEVASRSRGIDRDDLAFVEAADEEAPRGGIPRHAFRNQVPLPEKENLPAGGDGPPVLTDAGEDLLGARRTGECAEDRVLRGVQPEPDFRSARERPDRGAAISVQRPRSCQSEKQSG